MNNCELTYLISTLACSIAKDKSSNELTLIAATFTQLGDSIATIAIQKQSEENLESQLK